MRKKIAIILDYSFRIPNFSSTYNTFLEEMKSRMEKIQEFEFENTHLNFWENEFQKEDVYSFYLGKEINEEEFDNYSLRLTGFKDYFFNERHYYKFLQDYSFNLYCLDSHSKFDKDEVYLKIAQEELFDVVIIDFYEDRRKIKETSAFLGTVRFFYNEIRFLKVGEKINEEEFFGVWDPRNEENEQGKDLGNFQIWLKELESNLNGL